MAERANALIELAIAACWRLVELPTWLWVVVALVGAGLLLRRRAALRGNLVVLLLAVALVLLPVVVANDLKLRRHRGELEDAHEKRLRALLWPATDAAVPADVPGFEARRWTLHPSTDLVVLRRADPEAVAYCAIVDLTSPGVEPVITPAYADEKTLTSAFATAHGCLVAVNGEAGVSPQLDAEYGEWVGTWVVDGEPITLLDTAERPFLSFDRETRARYSPAAEVVTDPGPEVHDAIWGRHDLLLDGEVVDRPRKNPYSRTVLAIDAAGETLFLLVVDGRKPGYSVGLTYDETAAVLLALGAHDAMACDQGGSATMVLDAVGGVVNRPSDTYGAERAVYTHFGVRVGGAPPP